MRGPIDRRGFVKAMGAAGIATLPFSGAAGAESSSIIDDAFDLASGTLQQALIIFESNDMVDQLSTLGLPNGFHKFEVLPIGYTEATGSLLRDIADLNGVLRIERNKELEYYNDDARGLVRTDEVQAGSGSALDTAYTGETAHTAVIDSGIDGNHPDLRGSLEHNYRWVGNPLGSPTLWVDAGPLDTDDNGHGTHTSGTVVGDGTRSDGQFKGHAPDARLTMYSAGLTLLIVKPVAAYDHLLANHADDVQVVSNSYGSSSANDFDPNLALNVATWEAYTAGLLSAFSAGNSGPSTNTLNDYAKAPNVLGVAATNDNKAVTNFSSRGRARDYSGGGEGANYDRQTALENLETYRNGGSPSGPLGLYRNGVGAPGNAIVSTMAPTDPLNVQGADGQLYYASISGTSMSCPATAGIATLVVDAYQQQTGSEPAPIDVLNTVEATAANAKSSYTPANMGAGFTDGYEATDRAENGNLAGFSDVTLA
jgi:serine protease AprX